MASEYPEATFSAIVTDSAFGPRFSGDCYDPMGRVATLRTTDLDPSGWINLGTMPLANLDTEKFKKHFLEIGDLVISRSGRVGTTALFQGYHKPVLPGAFLIRFRLNKTMADPLFFRYFFNSPLGQQRLMSVATGSVQQNIKVSTVKQLTIPLPPLPEQKAIAHILGTLDDKIELNRRMNETLEAMARALFKSWFVDFLPVRVKAEAKASGTSPDEELAKLGVTPDIATLFPDSFQDSDLGEIPEGWEVKEFAEVIQINPSYPLKKGENATYLDMKNMPTNGFRALDWWKREFGSGSRFMNGDTLLARITPCLENGKTAFVDFLGDGEVGWGSTEYIVLRAGERLPVHYPYLLARSEDFRSHCIANMTGSSGRQRVPTNCLEQLPVVVPSENVSKAFHGSVAPLFALARGRDEESKSLSQVRDALLPKLLSGEVRVGEAEAKAAEVV